MPDARGVKPYKLLVDAMTELNKVAIGRIVMRSKERLVAIRPLDGMLCVETMRYADEVVPRDGLMPDDEDDVELTERERTMAQQLVESLASETFDPEKYHDEYREQLLDLIERKAAGEEIVAEPEVEAPAKVLDLVAALEASLAKAATAKDRHPSTSGRKVDVDDDDERRRRRDDEAPAARTARRPRPRRRPAKKAAAKKAPRQEAHGVADRCQAQPRGAPRRASRSLHRSGPRYRRRRTARTARTGRPRRRPWTGSRLPSVGRLDGRDGRGVRLQHRHGRRVPSG